ncbi:integrase catalytic domain-containing protein [Trichonephila clavipes]|nr:integrase catalytic domain-containing protein [Trichonephila clavipes]
MEVLPTKHWRHVPSKENPADIASRDEHGLVRVGGRLQNSQLRFNSKHPIILPSQHSISELLIMEQHIAHLHAGPTLLAHVLRQSHWIVGSRKLINKCIRKCLKYANVFKLLKFKTSTTTPQLMGNLPKHRVTLERPFFSCGIDYAGPVLIKCNKGRGTKSTKGYIALFVCLATKAVHIEAVGDLTTDSFIAALRRFSARRGAPRHIYSDNGTNFVGARRKLDEIRKLWLSLPTNEAISYYLSKSSIYWHFIPPSSPHFGGIWESGIRSVKFHLKRVLGETILTFEELTTLLTQIEGLLNSRPLSYVNDSDIECISTLTPSHFLTGDVLLSVSEELPSTSNHREIVGSCYRTSNGAFGRSGAPNLSHPYNLARNGRTHNQT